MVFPWAKVFGLLLLVLRLLVPRLLQIQRRLEPSALGLLPCQPVKRRPSVYHTFTAQNCMEGQLQWIG